MYPPFFILWGLAPNEVSCLGGGRGVDNVA